MLVTINILGLKRLILHNISQSKMANRREPAIKKSKKKRQEVGLKGMEMEKSGPHALFPLLHWMHMRYS